MGRAIGRRIGPPAVGRPAGGHGADRGNLAGAAGGGAGNVLGVLDSGGSGPPAEGSLVAHLGLAYAERAGATTDVGDPCELLP